MNTIHQSDRVIVEHGLRPEHRAQAAHGYWRAFSRKLRYPLGPKKRAVAFIEDVLDPSHAISAVSTDGHFLGMAGFKSPAGALVGGDINDLARVYGWFGAAWRGMLIHVLERDCADDTLLMDGIFVEPTARGRGVGTALLHAVEAQAAAMHLRHIRLDVIDTNPRARALYERQGFRARSVLTLGPLRPVFGFSSATQMTKPVMHLRPTRTDHHRVPSRPGPVAATAPRGSPAGPRGSARVRTPWTCSADAKPRMTQSPSAASRQ